MSCEINHKVEVFQVFIADVKLITHAISLKTIAWEITGLRLSLSLGTFRNYESCIVVS